MFGKNEIVGQKYFKDQDKLLITSRFFTIQGEGPHAGKPAVFIRLAKCNLACGFCDTYFDDGDWMTIDQIVRDAVNLVPREYEGQFRDIHCGVVLTGGEPMLQKQIVELSEALEMTFDWVQIETNGIVFQDVVSDIDVVVSPKCLEKNGNVVKYIKPHSNYLSDQYAFDWKLNPRIFMKFVMESPEVNVSPYNEVPEWALEWRKETGCDIFISPMNVYLQEPREAKQEQISQNIDMRSTKDEVIDFWYPGLLDMKSNEKNHKYVAEYAMKYNLRVNLQQHLYLGMA